MLSRLVAVCKCKSFAKQGGQIVPCPGLRALAVTGLHFAAGGGALLIDATVGCAANLALEGDAVRPGLIGATHAAAPGIDLLGALDRQAPGFGF